MTMGRAVRTLVLWLPLTLCLLAFGIPSLSPRLSLALAGHPFARVVPKEHLDVLQYVATDSFSCQAIVFSGAQPIGWIDAPTGSLAWFEPFDSMPHELDLHMPAVPEMLCVLMWAYRWWFLAAQAVLLFAWWIHRRRSIVLTIAQRA